MPIKHTMNISEDLDSSEYVFWPQVKKKKKQEMNN